MAAMLKLVVVAYLAVTVWGNCNEDVIEETVKNFIKKRNSVEVEDIQLFYNCRKFDKTMDYRTKETTYSPSVYVISYNVSPNWESNNGGEGLVGRVDLTCMSNSWWIPHQSSVAPLLRSTQQKCSGCDLTSSKPCKECVKCNGNKVPADDCQSCQCSEGYEGDDCQIVVGRDYTTQILTKSPMFTAGTKHSTQMVGTTGVYLSHPDITNPPKVVTTKKLTKKPTTKLATEELIVTTIPIVIPTEKNLTTEQIVTTPQNITTPVNLKNLTTAAKVVTTQEKIVTTALPTLPPVLTTEEKKITPQIITKIVTKIVTKPAKIVTKVVTKPPVTHPNVVETETAAHENITVLAVGATSCDGNPCLNQGECKKEGGKIYCICHLEYSGPLCTDPRETGKLDLNKDGWKMGKYLLAILCTASFITLVLLIHMSIRCVRNNMGRSGSGYISEKSDYYDVIPMKPTNRSTPPAPPGPVEYATVPEFDDPSDEEFHLHSGRESLTTSTEHVEVHRPRGDNVDQFDQLRDIARMRYGSESDAVSPGPRRPSFALNSLGLQIPPSNSSSDMSKGSSSDIITPVTLEEYSQQQHNQYLKQHSFPENNYPPPPQSLLRGHTGHRSLEHPPQGHQSKDTHSLDYAHLNRSYSKKPHTDHCYLNLS